MALLGIPYESQSNNFYPGVEHKSEAFLKINPLGQIPVIDDDGFILRDAQAILVYLASKYDPTGQWYPRDHPEMLGEISKWLAFADGITATASAARLHDTLLYTHFDINACRDGAHKLFRILDEHLYFHELEGHQWICPGEHPTIADIACFPYIMLSEDGGISRIDYPAIRRWCDRIKRIAGFVTMSGIFPADSGPMNA